MSVKYNLVENLLTERADDFMAQVQAAGSIDRDAFVALLLERGTTLTKTDLVAALNLIEETAVAAIKKGCVLNLPLFCTSFSISGVFESPLDGFDASRHRFNVNVSKGALLKAAQGEVALEKTKIPSPQPAIFQVKDSNTGLVNAQLTKGGVVELDGENIKIAGDSEECGLWFLSEGGENVKAAVLVENKPSRVIAIVPDLSAASCKVKIVTQFTGSGKLLKTPRTCVFERDLQVK